MRNLMPTSRSVAGDRPNCCTTCIQGQCVIQGRVRSRLDCEDRRRRRGTRRGTRQTYAAQQELHLHLGDASADAGADADSEGNQGVRLVHAVLPGLRVAQPALGTKRLGLREIAGVATRRVQGHDYHFLLKRARGTGESESVMRSAAEAAAAAHTRSPPRTSTLSASQSSQRGNSQGTHAGRHSVSIQRDLLVKDARQEWCHRIQPQALLDHPLDVRHLRQVPLAHHAVGAAVLRQNSSDLLQHRLLAARVAGQQVKRPLRRVGSLAVSVAVSVSGERFARRSLTVSAAARNRSVMMFTTSF